MIMVRRVLFGITVLSVFSCVSHPKQYVIGAAGPLQTSYGQLNQRGIDLAIDEINRAGGIHGIPLHVTARDDHANSVDAARIAAEFVANPEVLAVVGHVQSGPMVSAAHIYAGGNLVAVGTTPSSPDLTGISPWTFRMITSDSTNGMILAKFASSLGVSLGHPVQAVVLYENNAYGRGLADVFQHNFQGKIISIDPVGPHGDMEPFVTYYTLRKPDIVFVASAQEVGLSFLREARRQQLHAVFLGGDGWQSLASDTVSEGIYVGTPFTNQISDSAVQRFVTTFRTKYGQLPDDHAVFAYDATRMLAQAIAAVGPNRRKIREYLASLSDARPFHGILGSMYFTPANDPVGDTFRITRIHNALLIPVEERARAIKGTDTTMATP